MRLRATLIALLIALGAGCSSSDDSESNPTSPNILFVIMDDVGIDQMQPFGYGGATPPAMPNVQSIADAGVLFHNTWAMPACSTSRAVIFEGRFPLRTNVKGALGPSDLANSMVSPWEVTVPKLMAQKGSSLRAHLPRFSSQLSAWCRQLRINICERCLPRNRLLHLVRSDVAVIAAIAVTIPWARLKALVK